MSYEIPMAYEKQTAGTRYRALKKQVKKVLAFIDGCILIVQLLVIVMCALFIIAIAFLAVPLVLILAPRVDMEELEQKDISDIPSNAYY